MAPSPRYRSRLPKLTNLPSCAHLAAGGVSQGWGRADKRGGMRRYPTGWGQGISRTELQAVGTRLGLKAVLASEALWTLARMPEGIWDCKSLAMIAQVSHVTRNAALS